MIIMIKITIIMMIIIIITMKIMILEILIVILLITMMIIIIIVMIIMIIIKNDNNNNNNYNNDYKDDSLFPLFTNAIVRKILCSSAHCFKCVTPFFTLYQTFSCVFVMYCFKQNTGMYYFVIFLNFRLE